MLCLAGRQCKRLGSLKKAASHLFASLGKLVNEIFSLLKSHFLEIPRIPGLDRYGSVKKKGSRELCRCRAIFVQLSFAELHLLQHFLLPRLRSVLFMPDDRAFEQF